jgi:methionyl-tRNA formyltransferase
MAKFKVIFITQDDPIYVREFFDEFFTLDWADISIHGIVLAPPMGKKRFADLIAQMWNFYGPVDFVRMGVRFVATRLAARLPSFLRLGRDITIRQIAERNRIPVTMVDDLNDSTFVQSVNQYGIDVLISVAAPQIIKTPLIEAPKQACINIHNGKLPMYRGMLPNFWQMVSPLWVRQYTRSTLGSTTGQYWPKAKQNCSQMRVLTASFAEPSVAAPNWYSTSFANCGMVRL